MQSKWKINDYSFAMPLFYKIVLNVSKKFMHRPENRK